MVFRGNIVTGITGNTSSDQGMLFGTFLMKNIFIHFPTLILNHVFCSISLKFSCFLQQTWRLCTTTADKTYENHWIFDEMMQKIWFKIGVGNLMKIFFIRNVPNNIPWSLKVFPVMSVMIFPRKTIQNSCFFMFVDYCSDFNSKCMHYSIALQKRAFFVRARNRK